MPKKESASNEVLNEFEKQLDPFAPEEEAAAEDTAAIDRGDNYDPLAPLEENTDEPVSEDTDTSTPEPEVDEPVPDVAASAEETKEPEKTEVRIPKHRFDEVNDRRKAAEARLAELEASETQNTTTEEFDFAAKEDQYMDAVLDGRKEDALAIRDQIRKAEQGLYETQARKAAEQTSGEVQAKIALQQEIDSLQKTYSFLDNESEKYDEVMTNEILDLYEGQVMKGHAPAAAMRRASRYVLKANGIPVDGEEPEATPPPDNVRQITEKSQKTKANKVTAALDSASPDVASAGKSSKEAGLTASSMDITRMTEDEFDALPASKLRELRGDVVGS